VAVIAANAAVDALIVRPTDAAVIVGIVEQRAIVPRALLTRVPQRLIALRPLFVHAPAKVSDGHAGVTIRRPGGSFLLQVQCDMSAKVAQRVKKVAPAGNPTVLKRLLRKESG
jgi:hypothetical protein